MKIHSCGRVQELFPELIGLGLDVFNPFQPEAMDPYEMKQQFGHRKTVELPSTTQPTWLDLGDVRSIARVRLNGREMGTVWKVPYCLHIGDAVRPGENSLEIEVVNTWLNRLVGDDQPGAIKRWTSTTTKSWKGPLQPSGLLGPVRLLTED